MAAWETCSPVPRIQTGAVRQSRAYSSAAGRTAAPPPARGQQCSRVKGSAITGPDSTSSTVIGSRNIASGFSAAFARAWTATSASCSIGHPAWTHNLLAHPVASVNWRGRDIPVTTRLLTGPERTTARRTRSRSGRRTPSARTGWNARSGSSDWRPCRPAPERRTHGPRPRKETETRPRRCACHPCAPVRHRAGATAPKRDRPAAAGRRR